MNCICFEPLSRSRTRGTTNCAATKAKGMRIIIEAKREMKESNVALVWSETGSDCIEPAIPTAPPVASCTRVSYSVFTSAGGESVAVELKSRLATPTTSVVPAMGVSGEKASAAGRTAEGLASRYADSPVVTFGKTLSPEHGTCPG